MLPEWDPEDMFRNADAALTSDTLYPSLLTAKPNYLERGTLSAAQ